MALKIDKGLYDEKVYGGFEPTDPDDETFLLDRLGKYPDVLPYEVITTELPENLDTFETDLEQPSVSQELGAESKEISDIETPLTQQTDFVEPLEQYKDEEEPRQAIPYEKSGIEKEERVPIPYEKSGIEKEEREAIPYEKAGLLEDEQPIPFERTRIGKEPKTIEPESKENIQSIWDIFEEPTTTEQTSPEVTTQPESFPQPLETTEEQVSTDAADIQAEATEPSTQKVETVLITSDSIVDTPIEIKVPPISQEELSNIFDDDFRQSILAEIKENEKRRQAKQKEKEVVISTSEKEELQQELNQAEAVPAEEPPETEIDITSIDVLKPSEVVAQQIIESGELDKKTKKKEKKKKKKEKKSKEVAVTETKEQTTSVVDFEKEEPTAEEELEEAKPEEGKPEEEKKRRKVPVLWFAIAGGLVLIALIIGGFLYYQNYISKQPSKPAEKKPIASKEQMKPKTETKTEEHLARKEETQPKIEATEPKEEPKTAEKPVAEKSPATVAPKQEKPKTEPSPNIAPKVKTEVKQPKPTIAKNETEKIRTPEPREYKLPQEIKIVETVQEEYAIEIFSTADSEEAGYWLTELQRKGLNAYQKVHRVRNIDYYKIRVGPFRTIDEAKSFAKALGFKNVWIDRLK